MKHRPLVFLDIETTGGSAKTSRITDIGAIRVENGNIVGNFNQLINPEQPIPYFITKLTHITNDMVWEAPTFRAVADDLELFLDGAIFCAHHVQFDYSFIKAEFKRIGYSFNMDRLCTVQLDRRLYPDQKRHSLDTIIARMQLNVEHRHRGYDDANVLYQLFKAAYDTDPLNVFREMNLMLLNSSKSNR